MSGCDDGEGRPAESTDASLAVLPAPAVAAPRTGRRMTRRRWWLGAGCGLLLFLACAVPCAARLAPWAYAHYVRGRVADQLRQLHSNDYRIVDLLVHGVRDHGLSSDGFREIIQERPDLPIFQAETWSGCLRLSFWTDGIWTRRFRDGLWPPHQYGDEHVAVLVVDRGHLLRYHWSFRGNRLVLGYDVPVAAVDWHRVDVDPTTWHMEHGLHFCNGTVDDDAWSTINQMAWDWHQNHPRGSR